MSRHPSDFDDEIVDEASHSSVRTVNGDGRAVVHSAYAAPNVGSRRAQQQAAQREPLLAADSLAGTQSIRHAQRQAAAAFPPAPLPGSNASLAPSSAASVFHSGVAGSSGLSASPVTLGDGGGGSDPSEFEVSYDIDNSNYALNQRHRQHLSLDAAEASVGGPDLATAMQGTEDADARYVPEDEDEHDFGSGIASSSDYARFAAAGLAGSDSSIAFSPVSDPHGIGSGGGSNGLIGSSSVASFEFMVTPQRFWVLFVFCFLSFNQAQFWLTYSPITKKAEAYYGISESDCDLLLNWGPIIYLPLLIPIARMGSTARGVRLMVIATAFAGLICCVLRLVPEYIARETLHPHALWFLNIAHIINAASGPPLMATITKISCLWFAADERTTSTAILFMATNLGGMAGFLLAPAIVQQPDDMPTFLWVHLGCAALAFLCTFPLHPRFFFPEKPERFPSEAAAQMQAQADAREQRGNSSNPAAVNDSSSLLAAPPSVSFMRALGLACSNGNFMLLAVSSGVLQGIVSSWTGILTTVLPDSFSDEECGWFSFSSTLACIAAGIGVGAAATRYRALRRQMKSGILVATTLAMLSTALFLCLTPSIIQDAPVLSSSRWSMGVAITLLGAFVGATCPLAFELGAESTFPLVPESVSASLISGFNNLAALVFLFVAPTVSGAKITATLFVTVVACVILLLPVKAEYKRMDGEAQAEMFQRAQRQQNMHHHSSHRSNRFHSDAYLAMDDAASDYSTGSNPAGSVSGARRLAQAAHEDQMQQEFARVMQEVDEGMQPTSDHF